MRYLTQTLKEAMKSVMVEMAIDGEMDGDFNQLDMDSIEEKAVAKLKENKEEHEIEVLSQYLGTNENLRDHYNKLVHALENGNADDMADDYVPIWEKFELEFTVSGLMGIIKLE